MVTKRMYSSTLSHPSSVLAKILMVTKLLKIFRILRLQFCSSKNPYGNKTKSMYWSKETMFCSSKNPYGNKTTTEQRHHFQLFCSSKNPYGNKTSVIESSKNPMFCSSKNPYGNKTIWKFTFK